MAAYSFPTGTNSCTSRPHDNATIDGIGIREIGGRRYAECGHRVGVGRVEYPQHCGALIDITDSSEPLTPHICCGIDANHA